MVRLGLKNWTFYVFAGAILGTIQGIQLMTAAPGEILIKLAAGVPATTFQRQCVQNFTTHSFFKRQPPEFQLMPLFPARLLEAAPSASRFKNYYTLRFETIPANDSLLQVLQGMSEVVYASPNQVYHIDAVPNDPDFEKQWGLTTIQTPAAWEITTGNPAVLVGIIDTGIDYQHEDLHANIWINPGEDLNRNGQIEAGDYNGIDDDGNGFVDDLQGWDFTDAPFYPDNGDYLGWDNDPLDENGHGTAVAGIIAATGNNGRGIIGIAPDCRLLNLKAGTARGLLEEDDVATALLYAVAMGARIINMSFGDAVASPLLHDVMIYAHEMNCILIASAGNSATDAIHYPSGFAETIAVGALTTNLQLASYSNFGATIDLVAPGVNIWTTRLKNKYENFGGTSAAAPFVAGVAALVLSHRPALSNQEVRSCLQISAVDLGVPGWDAFYGAGRLDAFRALQTDNATMVRIRVPTMEQGTHAPQ
ncbi:S8 family serine peptidase, partial [candidate division KSB1 bacterium]|nr:S8 family serine peptidase [candidate division KSB1 bacterium]